MSVSEEQSNICWTVTFLMLDTDVVPEQGGVSEETESGNASVCLLDICWAWKSSPD